MQPFEKLPEYAPAQNKEIKISMDDLYFIFSELYNQIAEHLDDITDENYEKVTLLFNKYVVLSKLRHEESFWYDVFKKADIPENNINEDTRRTAYEFYIKSKAEREALQKEISKG